MPSIKNVPGKEYYSEGGSRFCGGWTNGLPQSDFHYCKEELFQKPSGEFFLRGEGGAASKYATYHRGETCFGRGVKKLSFEEAKEWAEGRIDKEDFFKTFGEK